MSERIDTAFARHLWLRFAASWVIATALVLVLFPAHSVPGTLLRVVGTSAVAVVTTLRRRRREERSAGGGEELVGLDRMLRRGRVPARPERRRAMGELVARRLHTARHRTGALTGMAVLLGGVAAMVAVTQDAGRAAVFSALMVCFWLYLLLVSRLNLERLRRMRGLLAERDAAGPAGGAGTAETARTVNGAGTGTAGAAKDTGTAGRPAWAARPPRDARPGTTHPQHPSAA